MKTGSKIDVFDEKLGCWYTGKVKYINEQGDILLTYNSFQGEYLHSYNDIKNGLRTHEEERVTDTRLNCKVLKFLKQCKKGDLVSVQGIMNQQILSNDPMKLEMRFELGNKRYEDLDYPCQARQEITLTTTKTKKKVPAQKALKTQNIKLKSQDKEAKLLSRGAPAAVITLGTLDGSGDGPPQGQNHIGVAAIGTANPEGVSVSLPNSPSNSHHSPFTNSPMPDINADRKTIREELSFVKHEINSMHSKIDNLNTKIDILIDLVKQAPKPNPIVTTVDDSFNLSGFLQTSAPKTSTAGADDSFNDYLRTVQSSTIVTSTEETPSVITATANSSSFGTIDLTSLSGLISDNSIATLANQYHVPITLPQAVPPITSTLPQAVPPITSTLPQAVPPITSTMPSAVPIHPTPPPMAASSTLRQTPTQALYDVNNPKWVMVKVRAKTRTAFAWSVVRELFPDADLKGKNCNGKLSSPSEHTKGALKDDPRFTVVFHYFPCLSSEASDDAWKSCTKAIDGGLRKKFGPGNYAD